MSEIFTFYIFIYILIYLPLSKFLFSICVSQSLPSLSWIFLHIRWLLTPCSCMRIKHWNAIWSCVCVWRWRRPLTCDLSIGRLGSILAISWMTLRIGIFRIFLSSNIIFPREKFCILYSDYESNTRIWEESRESNTSCII